MTKLEIGFLKHSSEKEDFQNSMCGGKLKLILCCAQHLSREAFSMLFRSLFSFELNRRDTRVIPAFFSEMVEALT